MVRASLVAAQNSGDLIGHQPKICLQNGHLPPAFGAEKGKKRRIKKARVSLFFGYVYF